MYHYVYYSYEEWGRGYIGVRSCKCSPEEDTKYFGSFYDKSFKPTSKIILATFADRESALAAEIELHAFYQVHKNPHFANKAKQTSTRFVSNGEGMKVCMQKYPDFQSKGGKIGGKVTHERHPDLASTSGKKGYQKGIKKFRENNPNWVEEFAEYRMRGTAFFQNNSEAAKRRGVNGVKAMKEYWDKVGRPRQRGTKGTKIEVQTPAGNIEAFPSINAAADELGIPRTTMKRMVRGQYVKRYKDYKITRLGNGYNEGEIN